MKIDPICCPCMICNLGILHSNEYMDEESNGEVFLPTEDEVFQIISKDLDTSIVDASVETPPSINEIFTVIWDITLIGFLAILLKLWVILLRKFRMCVKDLKLLMEVFENHRHSKG